MFIIDDDDPAPTATVLVKNTGRNDGGIATLSALDIARAQAFTTGTATAGYTLSSIGIDFDKIADTSTAASQLTVTLNEQTSGDPGSALCTLSDPLSFSASGVHTFSAPTTGTNRCPRLAASTTYFVVITRVAATADHIDLEVTVDVSEDSGGAAGWSIGNSIHRFSAGRRGPRPRRCPS